MFILGSGDILGRVGYFVSLEEFWLLEFWVAEANKLFTCLLVANLMAHFGKAQKYYRYIIGLQFGSKLRGQQFYYGHFQSLLKNKFHQNSL